MLDELKISDSGNVYLLDGKASTINKYTKNGEFIRYWGGSGEAPTQISDPSDFYISIDEKYLYVVENGKGVKIFNEMKDSVKLIFIEEKHYVMIFGNITVDNKGKLTLSTVWDTKDKFNNLIQINNDGVVLNKYSFLPNDHNEFDFGTGRQHDVNNNGDFAVCFYKSPSLFIGNLETRKIKEHELMNLREKYISKKRKAKISLSESIKLNREERLNYIIKFVNDTIIARATHIITDESSKNRSFVQRAEQRVEFFTKDGIYLGETQINGVLRCIHKEKLIIEESDEPDNRRISYYKVKITEK